jgi:hypothetical protein
MAVYETYPPTMMTKTVDVYEYPATMVVRIKAVYETYSSNGG